MRNKNFSVFLSFCFLVFSFLFLTGFEYPTVSDDGGSVQEALQVFSDGEGNDYPSVSESESGIPFPADPDAPSKEGDAGGLPFPPDPDIPGMGDGAGGLPFPRDPDIPEVHDGAGDLPFPPEPDIPRLEDKRAGDLPFPPPPDIPEMDDREEDVIDYSYMGTWQLISATMNGEAIDKGAESLVMRKHSYSSNNMCSAQGALIVKGNRMTMTVTSHNCPGTSIPAITQNYKVSDDGSTMTFVANYGGASFRNVYRRTGDLPVEEMMAEDLPPIDQGDSDGDLPFPMPTDADGLSDGSSDDSGEMPFPMPTDADGISDGPVEGIEDMPFPPPPEVDGISDGPVEGIEDMPFPPPPETDGISDGSSDGIPEVPFDPPTDPDGVLGE